jgi:hypothetical protein
MLFQKQGYFRQKSAFTVEFQMLVAQYCKVHWTREQHTSEMYVSEPHDSTYKQRDIKWFDLTRYSG